MSATQDPGMDTDEALLPRLLDALDDRIAETLEELLDERAAARPPRRLLPMLAIAVLALAASALFRQDPLAAWTIWPSTAAICLAIAWAARPGRSGHSR